MSSAGLCCHLAHIIDLVAKRIGEDRSTYCLVRVRYQLIIWRLGHSHFCTFRRFRGDRSEMGVPKLQGPVHI